MSSVVTRRKISVGQRSRRDQVLTLVVVPGVAALLAFHYLPLIGNVIAFDDYQPFLSWVVVGGDLPAAAGWQRPG